MEIKVLTKQQVNVVKNLSRWFNEKWVNVCKKKVENMLHVAEINHH